MGRGLSFATGEFYHVYSRGVDKRLIFSNVSEYRRFVGSLYLCNQHKRVQLGDYAYNESFLCKRDDALVGIAAYCLMPNHFHLLFKEHVEGGISLFMQKLMTSHTMYFNARNKRTGALFESTFKAKHVHSDEYLKCLIAYIHLNPVQLIDSAWKECGIRDPIRAERYLDRYEFSSYQDYCRKQKKRVEDRLLDKSTLPEYFDTVSDFKKHVAEWLNRGPISVEV